MNRREVLSKVTALCGAIGVQSRGGVVQGELDAMLAIIHLEEPASQASLYAIQERWEQKMKEIPSLPPCIVVPSGVRLEFVKTNEVTCPVPLSEPPDAT